MEYRITEILKIDSFKLYDVLNIGNGSTMLLNKEQVKEIIQRYNGNGRINNNTVTALGAVTTDIFNTSVPKDNIKLEVVTKSQGEFQVRANKLFIIDSHGVYHMVIDSSKLERVIGVLKISDYVVKVITMTNSGKVGNKALFAVALNTKIYAGSKLEIIKRIRAEYRYNNQPYK